MPEACWFLPEWRIQCESEYSPRLPAEPPTVHCSSGRPLQRSSHWTSLEKLVCRYLVVICEFLEEPQDKLILWKTHIEGKGIGINQGSDIRVRTRCALESQQDPCAVFLKGVSTNSIFCGGCSSHVVVSLVISSLIPASRLSDVLDRPDQWIVHLLQLLQVLLVHRWQLWIHFNRKVPCRMWQIQCVPAHPHFQLISHHLQRKSLERHAPSKWSLGPNLIWSASPALQ